MSLKRVLLPLLVFIFLVACGSSRLSKREEACTRTSDCDNNLVCIFVQGGGVCRPVDFKITATNKECVLIECTGPDDCCANYMMPAQCPTWNQHCMLYQMNPMLYPQYKTDCDNFQMSCGACDASKFACVNDKCIANMPCMTDNDCSGGFPHCYGMMCAQCATNMDCGTGGVCFGGKCAQGCTMDSQCPIFQACKSGNCTKVGCLSDRECEVYEQSPLGFCDMSLKPPACSVKCDRDVQCNLVSSRQIRICQDMTCVSAGCETDDECKAVLTAQIGQRVTCRTKK